MDRGIAIVGMACIYPDARSPSELWENVLAQRRAFRRIPPQRLRLEDYHSTDRTIPDAIYSTEAALIRDYEFDRLHHKVVGSTFRSADMAHWLALDVAGAALADAGFAGADGLNREETAVIVGNTLTGEFSRAGTLRLRWPYVRRVVHAQLLEKGWSEDDCRSFLEKLEQSYKAPFPEPGEESLAGGLSNTIAGRVCNHFDLKGGGYTVDGACAASLLAVTNACGALVDGDVSVALAGGVDLSLDPFELVGFARTGALAPDMMRVYDVRSAGFWPGEGCGFVVLMREEDAIRQDRQIYGVVRGWGVSSDGSGGITRPEVAGQKIALARAYRRAGFGPDRIAYVEGHGTGTAVGDATELRVLSEARRDANALSPAAIGSIKANIGHTKAAAGIAGFIKATLALHHQTLPPTTGCVTPHAELGGPRPALRVLPQSEEWPDGTADCAAVSAMGFGGINTHVVIQSSAAAAKPAPRAARTAPRSTYKSQDAELFLFAAGDRAALRERVHRVATRARGLSRSELTDVAALLATNKSAGHWRAAVTANSPAQLHERLAILLEKLDEQPGLRLIADDGHSLAHSTRPARIGFLFPGQGSPAHLNGGAIRNRFDEIDDVYCRANLPTDADGVSTAIAQPAIVTASSAAIVALEKLGITADVVVGHSLGELTALHWAGTFDSTALLELARARGRAMADLGSPTGAMASLRADETAVRTLIADTARHESLAIIAREHGSPLGDLVIAGLNSPRQTVISGPAQAVDRILAAAKQHGIAATRLPVSHAFHSRLVAAAAPALRKHLEAMQLSQPARRVVSTITGAEISADANIPDLLCSQLTTPVRFIEAARAAFADCDLLIEAGPGEVLAGLARDLFDKPVVATDAGGPSLAPLLDAVGAAFVAGVNVNREALFADRLTRPFDLDREPTFFVNPCELAPIPDADAPTWIRPSELNATNTNQQPPVAPSEKEPPVELVRRLVAVRAELPATAVADTHKLLSDLHLNSISVGQIVAEAARSLGLPNPVAPTAYANATVAELAVALETWTADAARATPGTRKTPRTAAGVEAWIRPMVVRKAEQPLDPVRHSGSVATGWQILSPANHPLRPRLDQALARSASGGGVVLCLPAVPGITDIPLLLSAAKTALTDASSRFIVVQQNGGGAALARTLHLEHPAIDVAVINVPFDHPAAADWVIAEASAASGFVETHYSSDGVRRVPRLDPLWLDIPATGEWPIDKSDVVLITGGGKGIAAECAVFLARETGAAVALLGRSEPSRDAEVSTTLRRLAESGARHAYIRADVTDAADVARAVREAHASLGPVTAILHAAGANEPRLLDQLDADAFTRTLRPKIDGLRNVLDAIDPNRLQLLVSFGSIIGAVGMPGQADYAVANDWLARLTADWHQNHPHCRCLTIDWSVWQSVGMGHRLGKVESLMQQGVTPIPTEEGLRCLAELLKSKTTDSRVIVAGRFGSPPTLGVRTDPLPLLRFVERPIVDIPGIELVTDVEVTTTTDPYVRDHALHGEPLFPAVMGLEAMAQVAAALAGRSSPARIDNVALLRPIVVPDNRPVTLRIAALARSNTRVEVVLRTSATDFQTDHFRANFDFAASDEARPDPLDIFVGANGHSLIPLDRDAEIYGDMLFHEGRFRRVKGYRSLMARHCLAELAPADRHDWFATYLPAELLLGDPAARDAAIHAIQSCIPHARLLPVGVERIERFAVPDERAAFIRAVERRRDGDTFTYDMQMQSESGQIIEQWTGLRLVVLEAIRRSIGWNAALLGNYIERRAGELLGGEPVSVVLEEVPLLDRAARSEHAIQSAAGSLTPLSHRIDGKPELTNGRCVAAAHAGPLTFAVAADRRTGCDIEPVSKRDDTSWRALLGDSGMALCGLIAGEKCECRDAAATRIWAALECAKKAGLPAGGPLLLDTATPDGWVLLRAGHARIATYVAQLRGRPEPMAVALLAGDSA